MGGGGPPPRAHLQISDVSDQVVPDFSIAQETILVNKNSRKLQGASFRDYTLTPNTSEWTGEPSFWDSYLLAHLFPTITQSALPSWRNLLCHNTFTTECSDDCSDSRGCAGGHCKMTTITTRFSARSCHEDDAQACSSMCQADLARFQVTAARLDDEGAAEVEVPKTCDFP